ncbi:hypothetical protein BGZ83_001399 [Gryganskiella cystojenkinii]|nr:hypothetical protein BGZ83_001399 [Gryganskiella cystojenkinii]
MADPLSHSGQPQHLHHRHHYQTFREQDGSLIRIPSTTHKATGDHYIIWTDIEDCFPNVLRIQQGDIFVPKLRDENHYRVIPHGIKHHPGIVLDVVCKDNYTTRSSAVQDQRHMDMATREKTMSSSSSLDQQPNNDQQEPQGQPQEQQQQNQHQQEEEEQRQQYQNQPASNTPTTTFTPNPDQDTDTLSSDPDPSPNTTFESAELINGTESMDESLSIESDRASSPQHTGDNSDKEEKRNHLVEGGDDADTEEDWDSEEIDVVDELQEDSVIIMEIVGNRVRDIVDRRYHWAESLMPKFFVPLLDVDGIDIDELSKTGPQLKDFGIHFCCDCAEIEGDHDPNQNWCPHCLLSGDSYRIMPEYQHKLIDIYGEYMMGVLEMLLYGAALDGHRRFVLPYHNQDGNVTQATEDAHKKLLKNSLLFLENQGIRTSLDIFRETKHMTREERAAVTPRIKPLGGHEDFSQLLRFTEARRPLKDFTPFVTRSKDVRWLCQMHLQTIAPHQVFKNTATFGIYNEVIRPGYDPKMIAYHAWIKTPEQAREIYKMVPTLSANITRFIMEQELSPEDHVQLTKAVSESKSVAVTVEMPLLENLGLTIAGFDKGPNRDYGQIFLAALQNTSIEFFDFKSTMGTHHRVDDRDVLLAVQRLDNGGGTAHFLKDPRSGRFSIQAKVMDINIAMKSIRQAVGGLHYLSRLHLEVDSVWNNIDISFASSEQVLMAQGIIEDTEFESNGSVANFFARRGFVDEVKYSCVSLKDNVFKDSSVLTEITIAFTLAADRERVRALIRDNKKLRILKLENNVLDDPSQIFETYKALMFSHATFTTLEIRQRINGSPGAWSEFEWRNVGDPKAMEVKIQAYAEDKIGAMLQKYATSITRMTIHGMTRECMNILERSFRPKKGPFKLNFFCIRSPHKWDVLALEGLFKVIIRSDIESVSVVGEVPVKSLVPSFLVYTLVITTLRSRLTDIRLWGNGVPILMEQLHRTPDAGELPLLTTLSIQDSSDGKSSKGSVLANKWIMGLLLFKTPLDEPPLLDDFHLVVDKEGRVLYEDNGTSTVSTTAGCTPAAATSTSAGTGKADKDPRGKVLVRPVRYLYEETGVRPLTNLDMKGIRVSDDDWNILLQLLDWSMLQRFEIQQRNPLSDTVLKFILRHIPSGGGCQVQAFTIEGQRGTGRGGLPELGEEAIVECIEELRHRFSPDSVRIEVLERELEQMRVENQEMEVDRRDQGDQLSTRNKAVTTAEQKQREDDYRLSLSLEAGLHKVLQQLKDRAKKQEERVKVLLKDRARMAPTRHVDPRYASCNYYTPVPQERVLSRFGVMINGVTA